MDPNVSVIIPVYNDPTGIQTTISSIIENDNRIELSEIIVIDNDSTDNTRDILEGLSEEFSLVSVLEERDIQSSYAARNTGIKHSSGEILLFLDSGVFIDSNWIDQMALTIAQTDCDYVGSKVEIITEDNPTFSELYELAFSFPVQNYLDSKDFAPTCALGVGQYVIEEVGMFDEQLISGGDREFGERVSRAGYTQCFTSETTAYHHARRSIRELLSKANRLGRGRAQRYHHSEIGESHPIHPIYFLPPDPRRLRRRYTGASNRISDFPVFYLIEYLLKLTQTSGAIHEIIRLRWDS